MKGSCCMNCLFLCFFLLLPSAAAWSKEIFVSPNGNDSSKCGARDQPCKSIDKAFGVALSGGANSTLINVKSGNYTMAKSFNLTNVDTFALVGDEDFGSGKVRITCEPEVSISFVLCENIIFERVQLHSCGGWRESTAGANESVPIGPGNRGVLFRTVLDFRYCRNAWFTNVEVSNSPGVGINFFNVGGILNLTNCAFTDNRGANYNETNRPLQAPFIGDEYVLSGGGVILTLSVYEYNVLNVTPSQQESFQHKNSYIFSSCTFLGNEAIGWNISSIYDQKKDPGRSEFSLGAGLAINFKGNASGCNIQIQSCSFTDNRAVWGGALNVEIRDQVKRNRFMITNTSFHDNFGRLAGGGVRIGNLQTRATVDTMNTFIFDKNCVFTNNTAIWGGGVSLYGRSIWGSSNTETHFLGMFNLCIWRDNQATVGSAIAVMLDRKQEVQVDSGIPISISFKDCTFTGNQVDVLDEGVMIGEGALYSDGVILNFRGKTLFINNTNTALSLDGSVTKISDHVNFINNHGYRGGALAMRGYSKIIFQKNSTLSFYNNSCDHKGGAMYIETAGSPMVAFNATGVDIHDCFFGYEDARDFQYWNISVIFQGNEAVDDRKGNSIYATTLKNCRRPGESRQDNTVLKWKFIHFKTLDGKISSRKNEVTTDAVDLLFDPKDWEVAPGEIFNARVELVDEIGNTVVGIVDIDIHVPEKAPAVKLGTTSTVFLADVQISSLSLTGEPGSVFTVVMHYMARELLQDRIVNVFLQSCHAGFSYNKTTQNCVCMKSPGIARCDLHDKKTVYLKKGYWAGKVGDDFTTYPCPDGYCTTLKSIFPGEYQYIPRTLCKDGRNQTSVLCGQCKRDYSIMFASEQCSPDCSNKWLWMILAYVIALIIVTCFVLLVNPNLSGGHLNACLYSYQIMKKLTPEGFTFDPIIEFLIGLTNFQLGGGRGVCFAAGLSNVDKLAISALFPIAEILLILPLLRRVLIKTWSKGLDRLVNRLNDRERCCCGCFCRNAVVSWLEFFSASFKARIENGFDHAFFTIIVLCYVDITNIALRLLHFVKVGGRWVLFDDGNVEFFDSFLHGVFIIGAILLLLFVIYIPLRLAIYPHKSNLRLETLHACLKPGYRSFVAYYLVCRLVLLLISTFMPTSPLKTSLLLFFCIFFMFVIATIRPYTERNHGGNGYEAPQATTQSGNFTEGRQISKEASPCVNETPTPPQELTRVGVDGHEMEEQQIVANEGNAEGDQNPREDAGGSQKNLYINESDLVILMTLSAIGVFSLPTNTEVSKNTKLGLRWCVRILAYVPLVMAFLPYIFYLPRLVQRYRYERREHQVTEQQDVSFMPPERSLVLQEDRSGEKTPLIRTREDTDSDHGTRFHTAHSSLPV